jgi:hypothetical protein
MSKKMCIITCLVLLLGALGTGCSNFDEENAFLGGLLPTRAGFRWVYSGIAEYGHTMELDELTASRGQTVYSISGVLDDPSGGEAPGPFDFTLTYQIEQGRLFRTLSSEARVLDNRFPVLELIRTPLERGGSWQQTVDDRDGKQTKLNCSIVEVSEQDGQVVYRVRYEDTASEYWEERVIREGVGVVSVEMLYEDFTIGYQLYEEASGYPERWQLNALLPPFDQMLRYFGMAEYAHTGSLYLVSDSADERVVEFEGEFEDGSGIPGSFQVQYLLDYQNGVVMEQVLSNSRTGKAEVNSRMHDPVILRLPLQEGTKWQQAVTILGSTRTMSAEIVEVTSTYWGQPQSAPVIRVRYQVEGVPGYFRDTYLEERVFQAGKGMIGFSQLLPGDIGLSEEQLQDERLVEEALIQYMFGYGM